MNQPNHQEPTNWEHCCSCCPDLEKKNKALSREHIKLKKEIEELKRELKIEQHALQDTAEYAELLEKRISTLAEQRL